MRAVIFILIRTITRCLIVPQFFGERFLYEMTGRLVYEEVESGSGFSQNHFIILTVGTNCDFWFLCKTNLNGISLNRAVPSPLRL